MSYFQEQGQRESYYDHSSDRDSDEDDMLQPRRSCSFSEAEGMLGGSGYYESFTMESSPLRSSNGLHHRSRHNTSSTLSQEGNRMDLEDEGTKRHRNPSYHRKKPHHYSTQKNRVFQIFIVIIGLYILLVAKALLWMYQNNDYSIYFASNDSHAILPTSTQTSTWAQQQHEQIVLRGGNFMLALEKRADDRFRRSRPPLTSLNGRSDDNVFSNWYSMDRLKEEPREEIRREDGNSESGEALSKDQLCGALARDAFETTPNSFSSKSVINKNSVVLITGILNLVGYSLAIHLKEQCGVQKVIGIDSMYPNTVGNRIQLLDRMQLLSSAFPKMPKPILLSFIGVDPLYKKGSSIHRSSHDEMDVSELKPTHIVHLSSFSQDVYSNDMVHPDWRNSHSPYIDDENQRDPYLYQMRASMVSMEQILSSFVEGTDIDRPQFLYASSSGGRSEDARHATTKLIDEILADAYYLKSDFPSVGLKLPSTVYGPWGQPGSFVHDSVEWAARSWNDTEDFVLPANLTGNGSTGQLDMLYVDDVVEAIVGAIQYEATKPVSLELSPETVLEKDTFADALKSFMPKQSNHLKIEVSAIAAMKGKPGFLGWKPQTSLQEGMARTIAWHLDRDAPYGPSAESGDKLLKRNGLEPCVADDQNCHKGYRYLPCASECNVNDHCLPSIFDSVRKTMRDATEGCDMVLYTQSLGHNIEDMRLQAEYVKEEDLLEDDSLICNLAIVPQESDLVARVIGKVPQDQFATFGLAGLPDDNVESTHKRKLDGMNGRLLYRGWILVWVPKAMEKISHTDRYLLKLSPGQFFSPEVQKALFVEENFSAPIQNDDCLFLIDELSRSRMKERSFRRKIETNGFTKRVVYKLPSEPRRRAAILLSPLRYPNVDDPTVQRYRNGEKKLTIIDATKFMRYEAGFDYLDKEPSTIRYQRQFYERIPSYVNREKELRSSMEPFYRYIMRHWVRTRWVLHDVNLEESRLLRCDWYREHTQWGAEIDQLSFAHVMALREVKRRIAHQEADDHIKTFIELNPELKPYTDSFEWHAMETETNRLYREPIQWEAEIPAHIAALQEDKQGDDEDESSEDEDEAFFIRIMSERTMAASRKRWMKRRKATRNKEGD
ncbi:unnamed protein product [Cylindrotheca closterium]|uniref:NAD-dependent epimerase/dehydratase domain-containing protein n=1 Tax=Cylindrotheca closterium TaxID=2856 RepID=A0AAD2CNL9_9STRA|nr:unnamed protein product [Cylindrotheca closterium]